MMSDQRLVGGKTVAEQGVGEIEDGRLTAEVDRQTLPTLVRNLVAQLMKQMHVGATKQVNGLIGIADREELARRQAWATEVVDQFHLHRVGVLQLVQEQKAITFLQAGTNLGVVPEQVAGQQQEILKIHNAVAAFAR